MQITTIEITNFRNLEHINLQLSPRINIFYGQNGAGKTSFLEAIHYLSLGRSFRTRTLSRLIREGSSEFSILSQLSNDSMASSLSVGIGRKKNADLMMKIGGQRATSLAEVTALLPLQLLNADSHQLLASGPILRRQSLDWGVFHVEPTFFLSWQRANRIIKQRNANLKRAASYQEVSLWDNELVALASQLNLQRYQYVEKLSPILNTMLNTLLQRNDFSLDYYSGWPAPEPLLHYYEKNFNREKQLGYTLYGPHRADLQLKINKIAAHEILSQGQLKLAAYALRLTQSYLLQTVMNKPSLLLIDDLPSELDLEKRELIIHLLETLNIQLFITGIEQHAFKNFCSTPQTKMFHVEPGKIVES